jgi:hypothetical protein
MTGDPRDYKLDLSTRSPQDQTGASAPSSRPFLSVLFACCGVYQRIYRDLSGTAYNGRCPRCGKSVHFPVGSAGTPERFFVVR